MNDEYMKKVIRRGNELILLEQAAACLPERSSVVRWAVAAALGILCTLLPSVTAAQACLAII